MQAHRDKWGKILFSGYCFVSDSAAQRPVNVYIVVWQVRCVHKSFIILKRFCKLPMLSVVLICEFFVQSSSESQKLVSKSSSVLKNRSLPWSFRNRKVKFSNVYVFVCVSLEFVFKLDYRADREIAKQRRFCFDFQFSYFLFAWKSDSPPFTCAHDQHHHPPGIYLKIILVSCALPCSPLLALRCAWSCFHCPAYLAAFSSISNSECLLSGKRGCLIELSNSVNYSISPRFRLLEIPGLGICSRFVI